MDQLQEWVPKIEEVAEQTDTTYVLYNNHQDGKRPQMADLLNLTLPLEEQGTTEAGPERSFGLEDKTPFKAGKQALARA